MVGRQTPILAVIVPLILVFVVDGRRGLRQTWLPAPRRRRVLRARPVRRRQLHLGPAGRHRRRAGLRRGRGRAAAVVARRGHREPTSAGGRDALAAAGTRRRPGWGRAGRASGHGRGLGWWPRGVVDARSPRPDAEVAKAYAPYLVIIAIFSVGQHPGGEGVARRGPSPSSSRGRASTCATPAGEPVASTDLHVQLAARRRDPDDLRRHHHGADPEGVAGPGCEDVRRRRTSSSSARSSR